MQLSRKYLKGSTNACNEFKTYSKFENPREMAKSVCRLLIKVNHALVAIFNP